MTTQTILATKIYPPALHPRRVRRARLLDRLDEGLAAGRQLTLISAPAGFGKTTCAREWLAGLALPAAWLSLEPADDDPLRFFAYFVAALQRIDARLGQEIAGVLGSGQSPTPEAAAAALANDLLRAEGKFVLALDDFHVIQEPGILKVLERLIANPPPALHLALLTREDPPLPLARLRANGQMTEIRAGDLRFAGEEAGDFLKEVLGLALSAEDVAALESRTEGWVVGLQLAGLSVRDRPDASQFIQTLSGSHRYILNYLTEEVLSRQPQDVQDFLLQTSILDRLSGPLCSAVTGRAGCGELLERLFNANLFLVALDDAGEWYRYHHLFAGLLRSLQGRIPQEQLALLHQRASQWYEGAAAPGAEAAFGREAIEHALAAADYPRAVRLLEQLAPTVVMQGYAKTVSGWMQAIPRAWSSQNPKTNLAFGWMHLLRGNYAQIPPYLERVDTAIAAGASGALRAEWLALRASLLSAQGQPAESIALAEQALEITPAEDAPTRGAAYQALGSAYRLSGDYPAMVDAYQKAIQHNRAAGNVLPEMLAVAALALTSIQYGRLRFAYEVGAQALERARQTGAGSSPVIGTVEGAVGAPLYEWNRLDEARDYYTHAMHLSELAGHNAGITYSKTNLSRLLQAEGRLDEAAREIDEAAGLLALGAPAWVHPEVIAQQVRVQLALGSIAGAEAALAGAGLPFDENGTPLLAAGSPAAPGLELLALAWLRIQLHKGQAADPQPALALAERLVAQARAAGREGVLLRGLLLHALLLAETGSRNAAGAFSEAAAFEEAAAFSEAVALAEPEGAVRAFIDEGPRVAALLRRMPGARSPFAAQVLAAFGAPEAPAPAAAPAQVDALTAREREVLGLIAEGLKYEEIAARLVVSVNTVRFHVKTIYAKLGANNRAGAVAAARRAGLLK